ncbi:hypothetical protein [Cylindrospermopsis raciborskii]|uniref:Uncharacterized protein n=1 Tax=Cylindrospermopsis raciborskii CENA302 TaxID=1170768 RepID=A0A9Q5QUG2_9CYAN|nr:hypothetical protein [Cylindrospermopsis raciborskii]NLQ04888.1 hypothetical protein [Cylindrospermopsis raciborskii MVCC19]OHY33584.1 hypothetical protein BCV64_08475 [Cylindrospermopsis raciborskii MVCC14]OPH08543.1 hypothetical protein CENA302_15915 [Cylindrospermopsis raciborskii CENA302]
MSWKSYNLDREAQKLVLFYRGKQGVISQSHKMRSTVAYGLERFWGEQLRLLGKNDDEKEKGKYWQATWKAFVNIMKTAGIQLPQEEVDTANTRVVQDYASRLWSLSIEDQRICLAVLTQFCDSLVWWTQRYKNRGDSDGEY